MTTLGIDPGRDGAAVLLDDGRVLVAQRTSAITGGEKWHEGGAVAVATWLRSVHAEHRIGIAALELYAGRPGEGRGSALTVGVGWGVWYGALLGLGVEVRTPSSAAWTREMFAGVQGEGKGRSVALCRMRLPDLDLTPGRTRKAHDGLADAGCLAVWVGRVK